MTDRSRLASPRALVIAFALVLGVTLLVAAGTSTAAFGAYNAAWDGASDLRSVAASGGASSEIARNTSEYPAAAVNGSGGASARPDDTVAIVLSPDEAYGPADRRRVASFVRNGGRLVVAEDYGAHSNDLLAGVGADARVDRRPLRDERYNYRSPAMPVARNVSTHALVAGVRALTLNHGTAVEPNGATVLVRSSGYAYLDADRDGDLDDAEPVAAHPVATVEEVGAGEVVVVGDPSLFINAMLDRSGNRQFARALFDGHSRVLLDYSHAERLPPLAVAVLAVRGSPLLQFVAGALCALAVVAVGRTDLVARLRRITGRDRGRDAEPAAVSDDALATYLRERYPEWDADRVRRVVAARRGGGERSNDSGDGRD